tara:strand:- start:2238 stop:3425 length:1188 start_codon:yes stop_codon:yes gene_type:complete
MKEKTKDFKPFIFIDSKGIFSLEDSSIILINQSKITQQKNHNGKSASDFVKGNTPSSWQIIRNNFPGDVRRIEPSELISFWNEKKLNGHFEHRDEYFIETLNPFINFDDNGTFTLSSNLHKILVDLEKVFKGRMLLIFRDESLHLVLEGLEKNVFLKSGNVSSNLKLHFKEDEPVWSIPLESKFYKFLRNKNPKKLEFQVISNRLHMRNLSTNKELTVELKPAVSSFNFASRWNPPENGPLIETVFTKDIMINLKDISNSSMFKRLGILGRSGKISAALFGNSPDDFLFLGNEIGKCKEEFQVVSHPMPILEDDYIISIYENQVIRLRSLNEDYEWMTFFEKEFSFINNASSIETNNPAKSNKSQDHLQLVKNKKSTTENITNNTNSKDFAKSVR